MRTPTARACPIALALVATLLIAGDGPDGKAAKGKANRLAGETSPYLLAHAHNPVDWYPWGPEAFARAKTEDKPIFLSVGYSACYWCHVMERESFEDAAIARDLNANFICIKVDREERPDVDSLYMTALQAYSGSGGWPMSMFLLPDGRPFFGGTYFPPRGRDGSAGFDALIAAVAQAFKDKRAPIEEDAAKLVGIVKRTVDRSSRAGRVALTRDLAANARRDLADRFDPEFAGFGDSARRPDRPKFPEPANLVFLIDQDRRLGGGFGPSEAMTEVSATLDRMARGGIRDQVGGGYHRYSTRRDWSIPHFEKMLYDNAQLASVHLLAFERTGDPRWRAEAEATFGFVATSLTSPEGAFYSSLDAESEGEEGKSYVWTRDEVARALGPDRFEPFARAYGFDRPPNFEGSRYVPLEPTPWDGATEAALAGSRSTLLAIRDRRPQPARDDKILTSWNGLMIAAYADGFRLLKVPAYRTAAERAADFLLARHRAGDGRLLRTSRQGRARLAAYLEDYAFLAHGLLRLHAATGDPARLAQAKGLVDRMLIDFEDEADGGFFDTADDHERLIARSKEALDNAIPGGNSVAIRALVALGMATGESRYLDHAGKALDAFSASMARNPTGSPLMLVALEEYLDAREPREQTPSPARPPSRTRGVVSAGPIGRGRAAPGGEVRVAIELTIDPKFHIYANEPGEESVPPTTVTLATDDGPGLGLADVDYPRGTPKALGSNGEAKIGLYEGKVAFGARVQVARDARAGLHRARLRVKYQACDDRMCLAPATLDVPIEIEVEVVAEAKPSGAPPR